VFNLTGRGGMLSKHPRRAETLLLNLNIRSMFSYIFPRSMFSLISLNNLTLSSKKLRALESLIVGLGIMGVEGLGGVTRVDELSLKLFALCIVPPFVGTAVVVVVVADVEAEVNSCWSSSVCSFALVLERVTIVRLAAGFGVAVLGFFLGGAVFFGWSSSSFLGWSL